MGWIESAWTAAPWELGLQGADCVKPSGLLLEDEPDSSSWNLLGFTGGACIQGLVVVFEGGVLLMVLPPHSHFCGGKSRTPRGQRQGIDPFAAPKFTCTVQMVLADHSAISC